MVLLFTTYYFEETTDGIVITLPRDQNGTRMKKPDVSLSDLLVKVSSPPCLFELDLAHEVNAETAQVVIGEDEIVIRLKKQVPKHWGQVSVPDSMDRRTRVARREQAASAFEKRAEARRKRLEAERAEGKRRAVRAQMAADDQSRRELAARKEAAHLEAVTEVLGAPATTTTATTAIPSAHLHPIRRNEPVRTRLSRRVLPTPARESKKEEEETFMKDTVQQQVSYDVAAVDECMKHGNLFLQSNDLEAAETSFNGVVDVIGAGPWQGRRAAALFEAMVRLAHIRVMNGDLVGARGALEDAVKCKPKNTGVQADLREVESALTWVVGKQHGDKDIDRDPESAARWYTRALRARPHRRECRIICLLNRSICFVRLCMWRQVDNDCSAVLSLDDCNTYALARRGVAREAMGDYNGAISDYSELCRLLPDDTVVKSDLDRLVSRHG